MARLRYAVAGLTQWLTCERVSRTVALAQLDACRTCPSARINAALGFLFLSCGEPGRDGLSDPKPTCGCCLARTSRAARAAIENDPTAGQPGSKRGKALAAMRPWGKTRCRTTCPQGRW